MDCHQVKNKNIEVSDSQIHQMFNRVAKKYDFLNHILSFGLDFYWRREAVKLLKINNDSKIIDLATGTGDLLISLLRAKKDISQCIGLDISQEMLDICQKKLASRKLAEMAQLVRANMTQTGLAEGSFDAVTICFGIRNTTETLKALKEMHRILKPGGQVIILELTVPENRIIKSLYLLYLRYVNPVIASMFEGNKNAYRYLDASIEGFYKADEFCRLMEKADFVNVKVKTLTLGVASIYEATAKVKI